MRTGIEVFACKCNKKENGITLIVVSIIVIVLLISVGAVFNILSGKEESPEVTRDVKEEYRKGAVEEQTKIKKESAKIEKLMNITEAQPGDKINYGSVNGYTGDWRVLYNDGSDVSIISMKSVKNVILNGKDDYNNVVNKLKIESESYMNNFAASARSVGSKQDGTDTTRMAWEDNTNFAYLQTHASDLKAGNSNYNTNQWTIEFENADYTAMQNLGIHNIGQFYWLASYCVFALPSNTNFGVDIVYSNGVCSRYYLWGIYEKGQGSSGVNENGLRPVITLKSDVKITGGDGEIGWDIQ